MGNTGSQALQDRSTETWLDFVDLANFYAKKYDLSLVFEPRQRERGDRLYAYDIIVYKEHHFQDRGGRWLTDLQQIETFDLCQGAEDSTTAHGIAAALWLRSQFQRWFPRFEYRKYGRWSPGEWRHAIRNLPPTLYVPRPEYPHPQPFQYPGGVPMPK